jgi:hypothetical protein
MPRDCKGENRIASDNARMRVRIMTVNNEEIGEKKDDVDFRITL